MSDCPETTDVEVHVFGPGYGECVLVHLGYGEWMIVDSCTSANHEPAAIEWLWAIGVDPSTAVKLVVATHWHDDHVRGLAKTFSVCQSATFICSNALLSDELVTLACDSRRAQLRATSGVDELRQIVEELRKRKLKSGVRSLGLGFEFATANKRPFCRSAEPQCEVWSLSPSSAEIETSLKQFCKTFSEQENPTVRNRVAPCSPNNTAVVLWVSIGSRRILLGADLEERRSGIGRPVATDSGWTAIVSSPARPMDQAEVFKVAHHGSATAHNDDVWRTMISTEPTAVLTPFRQGSVSLPRQADRERILEQAPTAYISARSARRRYKPTNKVEAWALMGKHATTSAGPGHVWLRGEALGTDRAWGVTLRDGACALSEFSAG